MSKSKVPARPYWEVRHEYDASLKAYTDAVSMLHNSIRSVIDLANTPDSALRGLKMIQEHLTNFEKAAFGEDR